MSLAVPADPAAATVQDEKRVLRRAAKAARAVAAAGQSGAGLALCRHFLARVPLAAGAVACLLADWASDSGCNLFRLIRRFLLLWTDRRLYCLRPSA